MKHKFEVGKYYKIKVNMFGRIEDYEGKISSIYKDEFRFESDENHTCCALTIRNSEVVSSKEIDNPEKIEKIHMISSKKKFTNLKESVHPEF